MGNIFFLNNLITEIVALGWHPYTIKRHLSIVSIVDVDDVHLTLTTDFSFLRLCLLQHVFFD